MNRQLALLLILLLLAGCAGCASASGDSVEAQDGSSVVDPIEDMAAEFRGLRVIKGHFEGGDWNDDVDKWMGRKHQLMIQLGSHLGTGEYSKAQVIRLLTPPDALVREGDDLFELVNNSPDFEKPASSTYEFLIYYWRGTHDFLYLTCQDEVILSSGWWYGGE